MTTSSEEMRKKTVRELGGEIYSEIFHRFSEEDVHWRIKDQLVDVIMGVIARHAGVHIENDTDLPVEPLDPVEPI